MNDINGGVWLQPSRVLNKKVQFAVPTIRLPSAANSAPSRLNTSPESSDKAS